MVGSLVVELLFNGNFQSCSIGSVVNSQEINTLRELGVQFEIAFALSFKHHLSEAVHEAVGSVALESLDTEVAVGRIGIDLHKTRVVFACVDVADIDED